MKLSPVERDILRKLSLKELEFLKEVALNKEFSTFVKITEILCDYEKDYIFKLPESSPDLATEKAYARGRAGGYTQLGRLILASANEIESRETKIEKKKRGDKDA